MEKWSSIKKGVRLRRAGVPMERRTRAPWPSDCSTAKKALLMVRGTADALAVIAAVEEEEDVWIVCFLMLESRSCLAAESFADAMVAVVESAV